MLPNIKRSFLYFDWINFFLTLILTLIGLFFVFSTTYSSSQIFSIFFKKQLFGIITGIIIYLIFCFTDQRHLFRWGYFLYLAIILLLIFTIVKGSVGMGAKRWINLVFFKFQPSELAKLFLPVFISYYFFSQKENLDFSIKDFFPIISVLLFSTLLILKQPDLGTAIIFFLTGFILLWLIGLNKKFILWSFLIFLFTTPITLKLLHPYQKKRIVVFLGGGDDQKERYQIEQSQIAIGSGGLFGKGFLRGTQNRLLFLPESRTDFIFSIICEEIGFLGSIMILLLYSLLFIRLFRKQKKIKNFFAKIITFGLTVHICLSTFINIAMVTGLLPTVGIPLPLISYGITNIWVTFASLGWINGITTQNNS